MKAEHRKELQTNLLADKLGLWYSKARSSTGILLSAVAVIVILGVAFYWWSNRAVSAQSQAWEEFWLNRQSLTGLESAADRFKGTSAERAVKLAEADRLFNEGFNTFFRSPADAKINFNEALKLYTQLSENPGNSVDLAVRGLLGAAQCHEWLGELEQAQTLYGKIVEKYETHPLASKARERQRMLQGGEGGEAVAFYREWPGRLPETVLGKSKTPPLGAPEPPPVK